MKYIRVIDDLEDEYLTTYKDHCEMVAQLQDSGFDFEGCIVKQADTIEELCDEFIVINHKRYNHCFLMTSKFERAKEEYNVYQPNDGNEVDLYGAIWTDKGLIYVAKMNDKGELELL